jgi:hypothetical protein
VGWVFTRLPDGGVTLDLGPDEREVLSSLPVQLSDVLRDSPAETALIRLSPPAYVEEPEHEEEYRRYMGDDLRQRQVAALTLMSRTAGATRLSDEEAQGWLAALNSLRLVLGTQLDVDEDADEEVEEADDPEDVRAGALQLYRYLSMLLDELVTALAEGLPEGTDDPAGLEDPEDWDDRR